MPAEQAWPDDTAKHLFESVVSTNQTAMELGGAHPLWVCAVSQSGGRGRRGRAWLSPAGNFYASLYLPLSEPPERVALRSFTAALALRAALMQVGDFEEGAVSLKWPNDVLLYGRKLAGILLESTRKPDGTAALVIGIGVNLAHAPPPEAVEATALAPIALSEVTGQRVAPEAFLDLLAVAFAELEAAFQRDGFAPLRALWLAHAARLGERIIARTGTQSRSGVFEGIDESGALELRTEHGLEAIAAADVFF